MLELNTDIENLDDIDPSVSSRFAPLGQAGWRFWRKNTVAPEEKINFFLSMARLLRGGVPIMRAFDLLGKGAGDCFLTVIRDMSAAIAEGKTLSASMALYPVVFTPFEINMTKAGEISASVPETLLRLGEGIRAQEKLKSDVKGAVAYPLFVLALGIIAFFVLFTFAIPKLSQIYQDFGGKLPFVTQLVINISAMTPYLFCLTVICCLLGAWGYRNYPERFHNILESLPLFGKIMQSYYQSGFCLLLSTLLSSGVSMRESMAICRDVISQKSTAFDLMLARISEGHSLSHAISSLGFLGEQERSLIIAGEESGTVEETLKEIGNDASGKMKNQIAILLKLLEPALVLLIGLMTGFLIVSMILPIVELDLLAGG